MHLVYLLMHSLKQLSNKATRDYLKHLKQDFLGC